MDRDFFSRLWTFHHWANGKTFDALASVSAQELDKPWGGSFKNGRGLLQHVVGGDRIWVDRWNGTSTKSAPQFPPTHGGREFRDEWQKVKADQRRYFDSLTPQKLQSSLTYTNLRGETHTWPMTDLIYHLVNHGTYHRGQMTQLLRDLGQGAPATDFTVYLITETR